MNKIILKKEIEISKNMKKNIFEINLKKKKEMIKKGTYEKNLLKAIYINDYISMEILSEEKNFENKKIKKKSFIKYIFDLKKYKQVLFFLKKNVDEKLIANSILDLYKKIDFNYCDEEIFIEILKIFMGKFYNINLQDKNGDSCFILATKNNQTKIFEFLISENYELFFINTIKQFKNYLEYKKINLFLKKNIFLLLFILIFPKLFLFCLIFIYLVFFKNFFENDQLLKNKIIKFFFLKKEYLPFFIYYCFFQNSLKNYIFFLFFFCIFFSIKFFKTYLNKNFTFSKNLLSYFPKLKLEYLIFNKENEDALYIACKNGNLDMVKIFFKNNLKLNTFYDSFYKIPLTILISKKLHLNKNYVEILKIIIENGANINSIDLKGNSVFYIALTQNIKNIVDFLIFFGADLSNKFLLNKACEKGNSEAFFSLIKVGFEIKNDLEKIISLTIEGGNIEILNYIKKNEKIFFETIYSSPFKIIYKNINKINTELIKILIKEISKKGKLNDKNKQGNNLLHLLSKNKNPELIKYVINLGVKIKDLNNDGFSPFNIACKFSSNIEIIELFLNLGVKINTKDKEGWTPLHFSCQYNTNLYITQYLIEKGACIKIKNYRGERAIHFAASNRNCDILKFIVSLDEHIDYEDFAGNKAIHWACHDNILNNIKYLISLGADIREERKHGESPFDLLNEKINGLFCDSIILY